MKRPEGFDPPGRRPAQLVSKRTAPPSPAKPAVPPSPRRPAKQDPSPPSGRPVVPTPGARVTQATPPTTRPPAPPTGPSPREARRILRRATRERRRYERAEVRRFTARQRSRRRAVIALVSGVAVLAVMLVIAVFSPVLALHHIRIEGTRRLDAAAVQASVSDQMGTPLALVDLGRITRELGAQPLIESYTTETVPPDTLVISITEREPIGAVENGALWDQVDPAGVVVQSSATRPSDLPVMSITGGVQSAAFTSAAGVLRSLPTSLGKMVHSISASTADDVEFVLDDGTRVLWGSDERPALKAQVLTALMKIHKPKGTVRYDVSSPTTASYSYPDPPTR